MSSGLSSSEQVVVKVRDRSRVFVKIIIELNFGSSSVNHSRATRSFDATVVSLRHVFLYRSSCGISVVTFGAREEKLQLCSVVVSISLCSRCVTVESGRASGFKASETVVTVNTSLAVFSVSSTVF
jgi:hypothetical protein